MQTMSLPKTYQLLHDPDDYHGFYDNKNRVLYLVKVSDCDDIMFGDYYWTTEWGFHGTMPESAWRHIYNTSEIQIKE
jgi:hypothetical protein